LNRKEGVIVSVLLITMFFGSAFAAPAIQQVFITNLPLDQSGNLRITVSPSPFQSITLANAQMLSVPLQTSADVQRPNFSEETVVLSYPGLYTGYRETVVVYVTDLPQSAFPPQLRLRIYAQVGSLDLNSMRLLPQNVDLRLGETGLVLRTPPSDAPDLQLVFTMACVEGPCPSPANTEITFTAWTYGR